MLSGIIIKGIGGFYYVKTENAVFECKARGIFRKEDITPLPGDRVCISIIDDAGKTGNIDRIMPRESQLVRPTVANVNQLAVVLAIRSPYPDFVLLDKLLVTSEAKNINVIICINKIDLELNNEHKEIVDAYSKANYKMIPLSSKIDVGFDQLEMALCGRTTVFAGQSGVGKSTILNKVMNSLVMATGDMSKKNERGKHTTRHAELIELASGGYVVDTPGFSSFELSDIQSDRLEAYYPEFNNHIEQCRFTHCSHIAEPGCGVKSALEGGFIDSGRYERYIHLYNALKDNISYKENKSYKNKGKKRGEEQ